MIDKIFFFIFIFHSCFYILKFPEFHIQSFSKNQSFEFDNILINHPLQIHLTFITIAHKKISNTKPPTKHFYVINVHEWRLDTCRCLCFTYHSAYHVFRNSNRMIPVLLSIISNVQQRKKPLQNHNEDNHCKNMILMNYKNKQTICYKIIPLVRAHI